MLNRIERIAVKWIFASDVEYTAIFLSDMEQARLIRKFGQTHPVKRGHHMTIWHHQDGGRPELETLPLGKIIRLKVLGVVEDDKAQVILVQPPTILKPRSGRVAHITLSTKEGVPPVYSNELIANSARSDVQKGSLTIEGRVGWWDGQKENFNQPA